MWVFVPELVFSTQLFPAAPEQLLDTAHMILDRKLQTLEDIYSRIIKCSSVTSNIPVRGNQAEQK